MFWSTIETSEDYAALIARLALGIMIFPHGAQKLLGWFGGFGFSATIGFLTNTVGLPWIIAFLVIIIEFFGGIALIIGALTRLSSLGVGCVMVGAVLTRHIQNGFFMNWGGNKAGEGFEFHILAIGLVLILLLRGGGVLSVDRALTSEQQ